MLTSFIDKNKKIIVPICLIIIVLCIFLTTNNLHKVNNVTTNKDFISNNALNKTYELENIKIYDLNVYVKDGISKLTGKVENTSNEIVNINNLYITIEDNKKNILANNILLNNKQIESGKYIDISFTIDTDLTKLKTISFILD